jgi:2-methylcitrate dehydratase
MDASSEAKRTMVGRLARWVLDFDFDAIPPHVIERAKAAMLDSLATAFAAAPHSEASRLALSALDDMGASSDCTIIGEKRRASVVDAVFANSLLIRALDFNDYMEFDPNDGVKIGGHPSDNMAVSLSVGEWCDASGRDVLASAVMGYEIGTRIQKLFGYDTVWDHTTATAIVAPAVAGRLLRLDEKRLTDALAIGMAHGVTPGSVRRGYLSSAKFMANAMVAKATVWATLLAARGVSGPLSVFEGTRGVAGSVFPDRDLEALLRPVEGHYLFEGACLKAYPCLHIGQAAVSAALNLRPSVADTVADIESIDVTMADNRKVVQLVNEPERRHPTNQETADHSIHFIVAVALIDGELTYRQYANERWFDPEVNALMDRVRPHTDSSWRERVPIGSPASVLIRMKDGREYRSEVAYPHGHFKNPLTPADLARKFEACIDETPVAGRARDIIDMVATLETRTSVRALTRLLGAP